MAIGYIPDGFVWAIDRVAGQAYPIAVDHFDLKANPDRYEVTYTSDPIEDRDDPTAWRWTTTVEVQLTTGR